MRRLFRGSGRFRPRGRRCRRCFARRGHWRRFRENRQGSVLHRRSLGRQLKQNKHRSTGSEPQSHSVTDDQATCEDGVRFVCAGEEAWEDLNLAAGADRSLRALRALAVVQEETLSAVAKLLGGCPFHVDPDLVPKELREAAGRPWPRATGSALEHPGGIREGSHSTIRALNEAAAGRHPARLATQAQSLPGFFLKSAGSATLAGECLAQIIDHQAREGPSWADFAVCRQASGSHQGALSINQPKTRDAAGFYREPLLPSLLVGLGPFAGHLLHLLAFCHLQQQCLHLLEFLAAKRTALLLKRKK